jgi:hypothetical protein
MAENENVHCPECDADDGLARRDFIRAVGGTAVTLVGLQAVARTAPKAWADAPAATPAPAAAARPAKPAESLIRELFEGLSAEQRRNVVYPWNHGAGNGRLATRLGMYNAPIFSNHNIGQSYTPAQQELVGRILRSISSGEDGFRQMTRGGTYDNSGSLQRCGAYIFGDPTGNNPFSWVFAGHHLTVRCDGNSEPNTAFGGPMYYGHSPNGYSQRNIFNYQTRRVLALFDALSAQQRTRAVVNGTPGEQMASVQHRREGFPGLPASEMTPDQRRLVYAVMRDVLSPFRREDADEVMEILGRNGGLERIHVAFYRDRGATDAEPWHFWRLEGPGFVWNYRVLPHVHTFVNIAAQA